MLTTLSFISILLFTSHAFINDGPFYCTNVDRILPCKKDISPSIGFNSKGNYQLFNNNCAACKGTDIKNAYNLINCPDPARKQPCLNIDIPACALVNGNTLHQFESECSACAAEGVKQYFHGQCPSNAGSLIVGLDAQQNLKGQPTPNVRATQNANAASAVQRLQPDQLLKPIRTVSGNQDTISFNNPLNTQAIKAAANAANQVPKVPAVKPAVIGSGTKVNSVASQPGIRLVPNTNAGALRAQAMSNSKLQVP